LFLGLFWARGRFVGLTPHKRGQVRGGQSFPFDNRLPPNTVKKSLGTNRLAPLQQKTNILGKQSAMGQGRRGKRDIFTSNFGANRLDPRAGGILLKKKKGGRP